MTILADKFKVKAIIRFFLRVLPRSVRYEIFRNMINVKYTLPKNLTFKIAETRQELDCAFQLLHDAYVSSKFMNPHPSGLRVTPYHSLPTTTTLIVLWNKEVIGTVSIIRDSFFGLPSEKIFNLSDLRKQFRAIAEISALAIKPEYRTKNGEVFIAFSRFLYEYCVRYFGVDCMIASVNPKYVDFYKSILCFEDIVSKTVEKYDFVNGAPAMGIYLDLTNVSSRYLERYYNKKPSKNMYAHSFLAGLPPNYHFPDRSYMKINDPVMKPEDLIYFFKERTNLFNELDAKSIATIRYLYRGFPNYQAVIPKSDYDLRLVFKDRKYTRFDVSCNAILRIPDTHTTISMHISNVSLGGFSGVVAREIRTDTVVEVFVQVNSMTSVMIKAKTAWCDQSMRYGFKLTELSREWREFIEYLNQDINKEEPEAA